MQQENQAQLVYTKKWMKVPANTSIKVSCKTNLGMLHQRMPMTFTPDIDCLLIPDSVVVVKSDAANKINVLVVMETSHNIQLDKNTYAGNVEIIKSITSFQVKKVFAINNHESIETINNTKSVEAVTTMEEIPSQEKAKLQSQDVRYQYKRIITTFQNHSTNKLRNIEDLLNRGWIVSSESNYSSPVVAMRKKNRTLRLCCDYRFLNAKTYPDRNLLHLGDFISKNVYLLH